MTTTTETGKRNGEPILITATPCCQKRVELYAYQARWTRHCTGGCKRVYDVRPGVGSSVIWSVR